MLSASKTKHCEEAAGKGGKGRCKRWAAHVQAHEVAQPRPHPIHSGAAALRRVGCQRAIQVEQQDWARVRDLLALCCLDIQEALLHGPPLRLLLGA